MKLTLDIPNEHAPRLLALLADLMPVRLEPQADPAEGHPELPLSPFAPETIKNLRQIGSYNPPTMPVAEWAEKWIAESTHNGFSNLPHFKAYMAGAQADDESEEIAETRWAPIEGIDAADPLKVEMEATEPVRDGDAEFPFPEDFPELPPLPEGYSRWVYRGTFPGISIEKAPNYPDRVIQYWDNEKWCATTQLSTHFHHIEAL